MIKKNRVPTKRELISLRAIAESQATFSNTLENELSKMQVAKSEIKARYEAQMLLVQTIQSELHQTEDFIAALESQKRNLEEEMEEYRGLLHPIRRYPIEILKMIFETTVPPPINPSHTLGHSRHRAAMILSHVCQHWRNIAVSTPSLWTEICVSFQTSLRDIEATWNHLAERVKGAPAIVFVKGISFTLPGKDAAVQRQIRGLKLKEISTISKLVLSSQCSAPSSAAISLLESFPIGRLYCLEVTERKAHPSNPVNSNWCWLTFLHQLPLLTRLELVHESTYPQNLLASLPAFPTVTELKLAYMKNFPLVDVVGRFPNLLALEVLDLRGLLPSLDNGEYVQPRLLSLMVDDVYSFPWVGSFKFPNLCSLHIEDYDEDVPMDGVLSFLAECRTLRKLNIQMCNTPLARLVSAAPQLHELILLAENHKSWFNLDLGWLTGAGFPLLKRLKLMQHSSPLHLSNFEMLVERRCLPASHPASLNDGKLDPLQMLVIKSGCSPDHREWMESEYLRQASFHQEVYLPYGVLETSINWL